MQAKSEAAFGWRPVNGRADVWPVQSPAPGTELHVSVEDEVVLSLPENRTTGYRWLTAAENAARTSRTPSPPPPPFTKEPVASDHVPALAPLPKSARPRSTAAVRRALQMLPPTDDPRPQPPSQMRADAPMSLVGDTYHASWGSMTARAAARVRRALAGDPTARSTANQQALRQMATGPPVGGTGSRILSVQALAEGTHTLRFVLAPPHDPTAEPATEVVITTTAHASPVVLHRRRLLDIDIDERLPGDPSDDALFSVRTSERP
jgi:hypothetical protein